MPVVVASGRVGDLRRDIGRDDFDIRKSGAVFAGDGAGEAGEVRLREQRDRTCQHHERQDESRP